MSISYNIYIIYLVLKEDLLLEILNSSNKFDFNFSSLSTNTILCLLCT